MAGTYGSDHYGGGRYGTLGHVIRRLRNMTGRVRARSQDARANARSQDVRGTARSRDASRSLTRR